jgi:excisionase family DNA binding protein
MGPTLPLVFSVNAFLHWAGINRTKFYEEIGTGRLKAFKVGRRTLIRAEDAQAWICSIPFAAKELI